MRTPPYLLVRDSGYYFRIAVPKDLRPRYGKTEIRASPLTHDRHVALSLFFTSVKGIIAFFGEMAEWSKVLPC